MVANDAPQDMEVANKMNTRQTNKHTTVPTVVTLAGIHDRQKRDCVFKPE